MPDRARPTFRFSLPLRVFAVGCVVSVLLAVGVREWLTAEIGRRVDEQASGLESRVQSRMSAYAALLRGLAAHVLDEGRGLSRPDFRHYFNLVDVAQNYPGVQGLGLTFRVLPRDRAAFEERARQDGRPDFRIWPEYERPEYHAILYLEPEDARNLAAIGYDMHTEEVRRAAMDAARDTGQPAITGRVTLVQEIDQAKQPGFLVYHAFFRGGVRPTTVEQRREMLAGFAYAPFRAGDFMTTLVEATGFAGVNVSVYDGTLAEEPALIMRTGRLGADKAIGVVSRMHVIKVLDKPWTFVYTAQPRVNMLTPLLLGLAGVMLSGATALLFMRIERARKRAETSEATTREREGELALLIDAVPAMVAYIDQNRIYRLCNRRYAEWMSQGTGEVVGRKIEDVVGPAVFSELAPHLRRALGGDTVAFERWHNTRGAGARFLGTVYVPHRGDRQQVNGVFALTSDLTAHKRAEESALFVADCGKLLIASMDFESTTRGLVHLSVPRVADVAVLFRAVDNELRPAAGAVANAAFEAELNDLLHTVRVPISAQNRISQAARTGMVIVTSELPPDDVGPGQASPNLRRVLGRLQLRSTLHVPVVVRGRIWAVFSFGMSAQSGRRYTDEHRQLAEEISTRVRLTVENALLYREAQQEVDERRRAERMARHAEERFRLIVEGVRDYAIMSLDPDGRIVSWNEGAERLLGYKEREAVGLPAARLYTTDDQTTSRPAQDLRQARERGAASDERWFERKDRSRFWATSHIVMLRDEDADNVRGYAWIMRDLTDRKRMEEELERRVEARTAELNEAVQELEAFSYSVSHDLRAPLRTIRGFTELVLEEASERLNEEERGYLDRVHRASTRLDRLIADLLAYTRVSKTKVELRPVNLHALVSDIQREHPEFQQPRADVEIEDSLLPVVGNEAYLTQCITNLVGNAVKFVREGQQPVVRISTERRGDMVRLFVKDNGIGIAPERLNRAFEMFERLHTAGTYEGTGVGLAIVRRAVQRMKGHVGVASEVGKGTTFWIELPGVK